MSTKLIFDPAKCVRSHSKTSQCRLCEQATQKTVRIEERLPVFTKGTGIEGAAAVGACPVEAFSLSDFSTTEFFFSFLESPVRLVSPKLNVPCLSVLSVEHLIALALASDEPVVLDIAAYEPGTHLYDVILSRIEEANFVLESISRKRLQFNDKPSDLSKEETAEKNDGADRRAFLRGSASLEGIAAHKRAFDEAVEADEIFESRLDTETIARIKQKQIPDKRKILFSVLKHASKPDHFEVLAEEDISFVSQKYVDESCTNCQICYRICPTGALSSDAKFSLIGFDAMLCVKCRLCHDVCEPDALHLQPGFETKEFFEPTHRTLAMFTIKRCHECGNPFTYFEGEIVCPRCKIEEEEALFLHQNAKKMRGEIK